MSLEQAATKIPQQRWLRIIPPVMIVYIFAFMDRMNIGFAMAGGMNESLGITASTAGMAAGIFFFGYLFLQIPGGHIAENGWGKKFIAISILIWGGLSALTGLVTEAWHLLVLRFFLGIAEGGVWPVILVIISKWFPSEERARANAFFIMNINIAIMITGPISGWIIQDYGWRNVFFIEGIVSVLLILLWWPLIDDSPEKAKWISPAERDYIISRLKEEQVSIKSDDAPVSYKQLFANSNFWKLTLFYFAFQVGDYGFMLWLPTILKELTKTGMTMVGFLSAVPFLAAMAGLYLIASRSDKTGKRRIYTALPAICFAVAFVLSVHTKETIWLSFTFLVICGFFHNAYNGVFWAMPPMLFPSEVCGGARGFINGIGNLGGFVGPFLVGWVITTFGSTDIAIYVLSGFLLAAFFLAMSLPANKIDAAKEVVSKDKQIVRS
ncbi:MFS transporter [Sporomusa acidovorans]|uniref:Tartrate transporter n=2 Tax=Sporomusa TaxID=2375 RepID=A0ABZ3J5T0_SPOA4|nr:MFS transporter [Sporomusa acidovorans]OZC15695.1 putative tartrate transporter [Sporomusa acidovorans DSM 3132]SDE89117.1 Sugar phosphate permease [Sporomusa acidovorans]